MQTIPQRRVCVLGPLAGSSGLGRKSGTEKALVPTLILERLRTSSGRGLRQLPAEACRAVWALWPPGSERLGAVWLGSALPSCRRAPDSTVGAGDKKVILKPEFPGMKIHII